METIKICPRIVTWIWDSPVNGVPAAIEVSLVLETAGGDHVKTLFDAEHYDVPISEFNHAVLDERIAGLVKQHEVTIKVLRKVCIVEVGESKTETRVCYPGSETCLSGLSNALDELG